MQCVEIIQSVDNKMSRKRTEKINNWPPNFKIFQYIDILLYVSQTLRRVKVMSFSSQYVSQTQKGANVIKYIPLNCTVEILLCFS